MEAYYVCTLKICVYHILIYVYLVYIGTMVIVVICDRVVLLWYLSHITCVFQPNIISWERDFHSTFYLYFQNTITYCQTIQQDPSEDCGGVHVPFTRLFRRSCNTLNSCTVPLNVTGFLHGLVGCVRVTPAPDETLLDFVKVTYTCSSTSKFKLEFKVNKTSGELRSYILLFTATFTIRILRK